MKSIRSRLNITIIGSLMLVLPITAVFLYFRIAEHVETVFDAAIRDKAEAMISLTELDNEDGLEFDFTDDGVMNEFELGDNAQYYQVWEGGKHFLLKSPSLQDHDLPLTGVVLGMHRFADLKLPDARPGRLIEINFLPRVEIDEEEEQTVLPVPKPVTLVYARERTSLDDTLFTIGLTIFSIVIVVLLITGLLIWFLVGRGLLPLSMLAQQVGQINESSLSERIRHQGEHSLEITPIIDQLNHLLERLQSAFERERRFSSNVAHELRTPLSELKALAEVGQMMPDDREQIFEFFQDVGEVSEHMEKVVLTLLDLSRSEAGLLKSDPEEIVLSNFCDSIWHQASKDRGAGKTLKKQITDDIVISTDREKFAMILTNIFINAISYSPRDTEIELSAERETDDIVLRVKNMAADLKPEDVVHMKDRFWRKNRSQGQASHSGLGLTLVDALARILGFDVSLDLDNKQNFMVTISGIPFFQGRVG